MSVDTQNTVTILDGIGDPQEFLVGQDGSDNSAYQMLLRTNGAITSPSNPQPVADAAVLAAIEAPIPAGANVVGKVGIDQTAPGTTNAVAPSVPIGPAVPPFNVLTTDAAITGLILPGRMRIQFPLYAIGTTTPNAGMVQINYAGGNSLTAPTATLVPGETDDWITITGTTAPHVSCPAGATQIVIQQ